MKAVILCGGRGTRLREETEFRPKPMVDIGGRPVLWHIMKIYAHYGITDFVLCLGYRGWDIKEYFLNYKAMNADFTIRTGFDRAIEFHSNADQHDWRITLADTGMEAMTGARVKRIAPYLDDGEDFMLTYGDGLADIDLSALHAFHRSHGKIATLTAVQPLGRFGEVTIDDSGVITRFAEKPRAQGEGYIAGGFFVLKHEVLDYLSEDENCILERQPLEQLCAESQLTAYQHGGFWQCMDTYREWQQLNDLWTQGAAPWACWQRTRPVLNAPIPAPTNQDQAVQQ